MASNARRVRAVIPAMRPPTMSSPAPSGQRMSHVSESPPVAQERTASDRMGLRWSPGQEEGPWFGTSRAWTPLPPPTSQTHRFGLEPPLKRPKRPKRRNIPSSKTGSYLSPLPWKLRGSGRKRGFVSWRPLAKGSPQLRGKGGRSPSSSSGSVSRFSEETSLRFWEHSLQGRSWRKCLIYNFFRLGIISVTLLRGELFVIICVIFCDFPTFPYDFATIFYYFPLYHDEQ